MLLRDILGVPYLFRNQGTCARKAFHCPDIFISLNLPGDNIYSYGAPRSAVAKGARHLCYRKDRRSPFAHNHRGYTDASPWTVWCTYFQRGIVNGQRFQYVCIAGSGVSHTGISPRNPPATISRAG